MPTKAKVSLFLELFILIGGYVIFICCLLFIPGINGNLEYEKAYICVDDVWFSVDIESYRNVEEKTYLLTLKDGKTMRISKENCILYNGELPEKA